MNTSKLNESQKIWGYVAVKEGGVITLKLLGIDEKTMYQKTEDIIYVAENPETIKGANGPPIIKSVQEYPDSYEIPIYEKNTTAPEELTTDQKEDNTIQEEDIIATYHGDPNSPWNPARFPHD